MELKNELLINKKDKDKDIAEVLRSMDAQIQTSRNGIISERKQLSLLQKDELNKYKNLLFNEIKKNKLYIKQFEKKLNNEKNIIEKTSEKAITYIKNDFTNKEKNYNTIINKLKNEIKMNDNKHSKELSGKY
jgi:hypothetical protein